MLTPAAAAVVVVDVAGVAAVAMAAVTTVATAVVVAIAVDDTAVDEPLSFAHNKVRPVGRDAEVAETGDATGV